jgi:hypothetical protein
MIFDCTVCCGKAKKAEARNHTHPLFTTCGFPYEDWFQLGAIRYCPPQLLWAYPELDMFEDGDFPGKPGELRKIDSNIIVAPRINSPTSVQELWCELTDRLAMLPENRRILFLKEVRPEIDIRALNNENKLRLKKVEIKDLCFDNKKVLKFLSFQRKKMDFNAWEKQEEYRRKQQEEARKKANERVVTSEKFLTGLTTKK